MKLLCLVFCVTTLFVFFKSQNCTPKYLILNVVHSMTIFCGAFCTPQLTHFIYCSISGLESALSKTSFTSKSTSHTPTKSTSRSHATSFSSASNTPQQAGGVSPHSGMKSGEALIDVLKIRAARLGKSEDFIAKFLEVSDVVCYFICVRCGTSCLAVCLLECKE